MNSMTGFAQAQVSLPQAQIAVEIKSYNNRYLETFFHLPGELASLESWSREELSRHVHRGKVSTLAKITWTSGLTHILDVQRAQEFAHLLNQLAAMNVQPHYNFTDLQNYGIFQENAPFDPVPLYQRVFIQALYDLQSSRSQEGLALQKDLQNQIENMQQLLKRIQSLKKEADEQTVASLREKFRTLIGDPIPERRVTEEIAAYLIKIDIHEEIIRLETHICSLKKLMQDHQPVGRKIDFLCQELQREITTLGNKTPCADLQQIGVEMKNIIEKIREQARNVE